jgi:acetolactate synthase-1/2/3 large subunit
VTVVDVLMDGLGRAGVERLFSSPRVGALGLVLAASGRRGLPVVACGSAGSACVAAAVTGMLTSLPGAAVIDALSQESGAAGVLFARRNRAPLIVVSPAADASERADRLENVVKGSWPLTRTSVGHWVAHAARLALTHPRGPVHLTLAQEELQAAALPVTAASRLAAALAPEPASLAAAAGLIRGASRPVVIAGRGCRRDDAPWLRAFMEAMPAPVLTTATARGVVPEPHPLSLGVLDGEHPASPVVDRADLIITVGVDRDELAGWQVPPSKAHVDLALDEPEASSFAVTRVVGGPGAIFAELASRLAGRSRADWDVAELDRVKRGLAGPTRPAGRPCPTLPSSDQAAPGPVDGSGQQVGDGSAASLDPRRIVRLARELTAAGAIATFDGGRAWSAQHGWQAVEPGDCLVPVDRATAGIAIPSAIAAALTFPGRQVLAFVDGSVLSGIEDELTTVKRLGLPIVVVVLDAWTEDAFTLAQRSGLPARAVADEPSAERALVTALASPVASVVVVRGAAGGDPSPRFRDGRGAAGGDPSP